MPADNARRLFLQEGRIAMPAFDLDLGRREAPEVLWDRLWDLDRHTASIPLTTVVSDDGAPLRLASRFVGRTALGPIHLDDRMVVREWQPPHRAVIEKVGALRGTITVTLTSDADGTLLHWHQSFGAPHVPHRVAALLRPALVRGYRASLHRILADPADAAAGSV